VRNWPDGSIYHVITEGQNIMPSYAGQVRKDDRWAIVHYIRALQRAHFAKESDLK
jgi:mono/diheme cytochrome c family protein